MVTPCSTYIIPHEISYYTLELLNEIATPFQVQPQSSIIKLNNCYVTLEVKISLSDDSNLIYESVSFGKQAGSGI